MTSRVDSSRRGLFRTVGATLWIAAGLCFFLFEALVAAAVVTAYSYGSYISSLGVPAWSPLAILMNSAFFLQGISFLAGAVLVVVNVAARKAVLFLGFAAMTAVGNFLVGAVHTTPDVGSGPGWHFIGAALAIVGGNAAILSGSSVLRRVGASRVYRLLSIALGALGFLCLAAMWVDSSQTVLPAGIWERGSVYSILIWQIFTGGYLVRTGLER